ncbi:MAG: aldolase [Patescibacteria group bacterium]|jgi:fructose-bisphosphate aldolase/6-deoxy-5-ketofructose 1-phosphate synthase
MIKKITASNVIVPLDVPKAKKTEYVKNYLKLTHNTGRMMLFAGDQKVEHLNDDFFDGGKEISLEDADPEHLWKIASTSPISCLAVQAGYAAKFAPSYPKVPLLIKLNSKSHLVKTEQKEPLSKAMTSVAQVMELKKNGANILAVGYTIYLCSEFEDQMISEASNIIANAHQNGLLSVIWIYPRGKAVKDEKDGHLIAGATGVACTLGSDFVKVNYPQKEGVKSEEIFKEAIVAGGRTGVITSGGSSTDPKKFLERLHQQINISGAVGSATGRNIHQKPLAEAINFCKAISAITFNDSTVDEAYQIYQGK